MEEQIKTKFRTEETRLRTKTNPGTKTLDLYEEKINQKGKRELVKVGTTNVYNKIQSGKDETLIYNIIDRYKKTGDPNVLMRREAIYGEFLNTPGTPIELQNQLLKAEQSFFTLDKDVRDAFNNDIGEFKASILNGSFNEKFKTFISKKNSTVQQPAQTTVQQPGTTTTTEQGGIKLSE